MGTSKNSRTKIGKEWWNIEKIKIGKNRKKGKKLKKKK